MEFRQYRVEKDLIVIGAGMPGICAAIQAARLGLSVALINNRGYLGGNASAEIGVSVDGADGMQEFNLWARETGIIDELRLENLYRNPQKNRYIWDAVLMDAVLKEKNIELFLNTNIDKVEMKADDLIEYVSGSQLGSEKRFNFYAPLFLDDTGDGTVGYLAGADFRMGRESGHEFDESAAPEEADDCVLPSTLTFHAKDTGKPVRYIRPGFALDITKTEALKYRTIPRDTFYRSQWYYEGSGRINQIENSEAIIQQHRELVYGIWDYIKNSGEYGAENYDFEYIAPVPGKRESRRLMGDHILSERDITEQRDFEDTVGHGGWSIDLHAVDGFFSKDLVNKHIFLKGIYQIPYRTGYSRNISNLFFAGRCMSTTHVAFGSTRVMATLSTLGQALGAAAYLCKKYDLMPRDIYKSRIQELRQLLLRHDQYIVGCKNEDPDDLARSAKITASSESRLCLEDAEFERPLDKPLGLIIPVDGCMASISIPVRAASDTAIEYTVYEPVKRENYNPERIIARGRVDVRASSDPSWVRLPLNVSVDRNKIFIELSPQAGLYLGMTRDKLPGVMSMVKNPNGSPTLVDAATMQMKEFIWRPIEGTVCFKADPDHGIYSSSNVNNGYSRPYGLPNLWLSEKTNADQCGEYIRISWHEVKTINEIILYFDDDLNYRISYWPVENNVIPEVVRDYDILYKSGDEYRLLKSVRGNYKRVNNIKADSIQTGELKLVFHATNGFPRVGLYEVRVY